MKKGWGLMEEPRVYPRKKKGFLDKPSELSSSLSVASLCESEQSSSGWKSRGFTLGIKTKVIFLIYLIWKKLITIRNI
jgi:hypothetical protein